MMAHLEDASCSVCGRPVSSWVCKSSARGGSRSEGRVELGNPRRELGSSRVWETGLCPATSTYCLPAILQALLHPSSRARSGVQMNAWRACVLLAILAVSAGE